MDFYPIKAQYYAGEEIKLRIESDPDSYDEAEIRIFSLEKMIEKMEIVIEKEVTDVAVEYIGSAGGYGGGAASCRGGGKRSFLSGKPPWNPLIQRGGNRYQWRGCGDPGVWQRPGAGEHDGRRAADPGNHPAGGMGEIEWSSTS